MAKPMSKVCKGIENRMLPDQKLTEKKNILSEKLEFRMKFKYFMFILILTCSMLYNDIAKKTAFGGKSENIAPLFILPTILKMLFKKKNVINEFFFENLIVKKIVKQQKILKCALTQKSSHEL